MTLTDFLLARIAEDDANGWVSSGLRAEPYSRTRAHLECEAKRRIVEKLERRWDEADAAAEDPNLSVRERGSMNRMYSSQATGLASAVRALAEVYADHPDYREEWRP